MIGMKDEDIGLEPNGDKLSSSGCLFRGVGGGSAGFIPRAVFGKNKSGSSLENCGHPCVQMPHQTKIRVHNGLFSFLFACFSL